MQSFAYANPATVQEAVALLSPKWGEADVLAGGTDLLSLMKEHLHTPKPRRQHQKHQGTRRHPEDRRRHTHRRPRHHG